MAIPNDKERVMITLPKEGLKRIDLICERYRMTRSEVLFLAFEQAEETLKMWNFIGFSPENLRAVSGAIAKGLEILGLTASPEKVRAHSR